jgi:hypothetical protein
MQAMKKTDMKKLFAFGAVALGFELCLCADRQRTKEQRAVKGHC